MLAELRIDLGAIRANVQALAALVAPARIAAVVKANGYGHGLAAVAAAIAPHVDRLCVYALDEAVTLRDAGIASRIHVLGPVPAAELDVAHAAGVELTLWDRTTYAAQMARVARRRRSPFTVHAKIDTGVTRLGVAAGEAPAALARWLATPEYRIAGVFSHLAAAEELDSSYTHEQLARFLQATTQIDAAVERHIAATAAAMLWSETRLGAVRTGIGIYGLWPSEPTQRIMTERGFALVPALEWRTQIALVHDVAADTAVGYGCTYRTERPARIAVLPIGYAEGLPRARSSRGAVLVGGTRAPLVGRVCMNMSFVDVTGIAGVHPGTPVTLIGADGGERITADEFAAWCDSINYEIVARLPAEVPRTYRS